MSKKVGTLHTFSTGGARLKTPVDEVFVPVPVNRSLSVRVADEVVQEAWVDGGRAQTVDGEHRDLAPDWLVKRAQGFVDDGLLPGGTLAPAPRPIIFAPPWYPGEKHGFLRLDALDALALCERSVVSGPPGSGKSSVSRFLAFAFATHHLNAVKKPTTSAFLDRWPHACPVPIYVELRRLFLRPEMQDPDARVGVSHLWKYLSHDLGLDEGDVRTALTDVPAIVILDGVDEIPLPPRDDGTVVRSRQVQALCDALDTSLDSHRLILTCRDYALSNWQLDVLEDFRIAPMLPSDGAQLLRRLSLRRMASPAEADAEVERVMAAMRTVPAALRDYPLFLSLMAAVYWEDGGGGLPHTRAGLYQRSIGILLDRWSADDGGEQGLLEQLQCSRDDLIDRLERIAFEAHVHSGTPGSDDPTELELSVILVELFRLGHSVHSGKVLAYLTEHAGVLVARDKEVFSFAHRGFQEYLAGAHLRRVAESRLSSPASTAFPDVVELFVSGPTLWREPLLLMAEGICEGDRPDDVWTLLAELMAATESHEYEGESASWLRWLVSRVFIDQRLHERVTALARPHLARVTGCAVELLSSGDLTASERWDAARVLGVLGDPRSGVGIKADGTPEVRFESIPAGVARLGTSDDDISRLDPALSDGWTFGRDTPACEITLAEFRIAAVPVTNAQFDAFVRADDGYSNDAWWQEDGLVWRDRRGQLEPMGFAALPNMPAVYVSWYEALAFCGWLSSRLGFPVRLPTEAEWEYAARPDGRLFAWGDEFDVESCNSTWSGFGQPLPVGCYGSGSQHGGLADMCGNVWEWCSTAATDAAHVQYGYPYAVDDGRESLDLGSTAYRVVRGGSFVNIPFLLRCAYRGRDLPGTRAVRIGFRIATSVPSTKTEAT